MLPNFSRQMHSLCYATSTKHCTALHWCCTGEFQKVGNAKQHFEHLPGHFQCTRTWRDAPWPLESSTLLCIVPMVFKMRHCSLFIFLFFCFFVFLFFVFFCFFVFFNFFLLFFCFCFMLFLPSGILIPRWHSHTFPSRAPLDYYRSGLEPVTTGYHIEFCIGVYISPFVIIILNYLGLDFRFP